MRTLIQVKSTHTCRYSIGMYSTYISHIVCDSTDLQKKYMFWYAYKGDPVRKCVLVSEAILNTWTDQSKIDAVLEIMPDMFNHPVEFRPFFSN